MTCCPECFVDAEIQAIIKYQVSFTKQGREMQLLLSGECADCRD